MKKSGTGICSFGVKFPNWAELSNGLEVHEFKSTSTHILKSERFQRPDLENQIPDLNSNRSKSPSSDPE